MTQRDNILQELKELQSPLAGAGFENLYTVPAGYFDNLAAEVLGRIKAIDAVNASEELRFLSPLLNSISKEMPYSLPAGFFNEQEEKTLQLIKGVDNDLTVEEELSSISPLLNSLKKEMPYSVPAGYFDGIDSSIATQGHKTTKVVSMPSQRWFRYAAAAIVIGFVAIGGFFLFNKKDNIDPKTQSAEWVNKNMKKVSTDEIDNFVELSEPLVAKVEVKNDAKDKKEVQELIKDIPDKDIQNFLDDTQVTDQESGD
jgi:hypothetical protein